MVALLTKLMIEKKPNNFSVLVAHNGGVFWQLVYVEHNGLQQTKDQQWNGLDLL